jgi:hypothetical protein
MLSNGEYVVRAAAVDKLGVPLLNAINRGDWPLADDIAGHRANGGLVGGLVIRKSAFDASQSSLDALEEASNNQIKIYTQNDNSSAGGSVQAALNIYGDIKSGSDEDDLWDSFNDLLAGALAFR